MFSPGIYGRFVAPCPDGVQCVWCRGGNASILFMFRVQYGKFACFTKDYRIPKMCHLVKF